MNEVEKTCENCEYEHEDTEGTHCRHCIHNAEEKFKQKAYYEKKIECMDDVIERLQYKANNIRAKLEPSYFTECIDYLKSLPREERYSETDELDGYGYGCTNKTCVARVRNKAIDEFTEKLSTNVESFQAEADGIKVDLMTEDYFHEYIWEIAEKMKGE